MNIVRDLAEPSAMASLFSTIHRSSGKFTKIYLKKLKYLQKIK